ncbi:MAG TPA: 4a-hydroxytetrahydrobiopterin dehydratase [Vicinamibacteria bacterium]|nr:4a-hydroxytetrahydrobiopterin dehydratase [Vicinamibacteria bacterium]
MALLTETEIRESLGRLQGWERRGNEIRRTWSFADFDSSMAFVNRVAALARSADHHPDIDIRYSKVTLALSTHDAGGLTARDFELAEAIGA